MLSETAKEALRGGLYERTPEGIYIPKEGLLAQGMFVVNKRGEDEEWTENLVVNEGLDYLIGAAFGKVSVISNWYIAVFSGDVTVQATWTAANFTANSTENTQYASATRPAWTSGSVASGALDSFSSKASFVANLDSQVLRGAALLSNAVKSSTTGTLIAASRFASDKNLDDTEILDVGYGLTLTAV